MNLELILNKSKIRCDCCACCGDKVTDTKNYKMFHSTIQRYYKVSDYKIKPEPELWLCPKCIKFDPKKYKSSTDFKELTKKIYQVKFE